METNLEREGLDHLEHIENELEQIKERTGGSWRSFFGGLLQGSGAVVGGVLAVTLIGWILSIFGIIPGFGHLAAYLSDSLDKLHPH